MSSQPRKIFVVFGQDFSKNEKKKPILVICEIEDRVCFFSDNCGLEIWKKIKETQAYHR